MSENQTETKQSDEEIIANSPFAKKMTFKRNGVELLLTPIVGTRGKWSGMVYAAPQFGIENANTPFAKNHKLLEFLTGIGEVNVVTMVDTWLRRVGQDYTVNATGKDGTPDAGKFNIPRFMEQWEKLTAAGQKIGEMEEQIDKENSAFQVYVTGQFLEQIATASPEEAAVLKAGVTERSNRIKALKFALEQRKASYSKEAATDEVRPS